MKLTYVGRDMNVHKDFQFRFIIILILLLIGLEVIGGDLSVKL